VPDIVNLLLLNVCLLCRGAAGRHVPSDPHHAQGHTDRPASQVNLYLLMHLVHSVEELFYFTIVKSCDVFHKNPAGKRPVAQDFQIQIYLDFIYPQARKIYGGVR